MDKNTKLELLKKKKAEERRKKNLGELKKTTKELAKKFSKPKKKEPELTYVQEICDIDINLPLRLKPSQPEVDLTWSPPPTIIKSIKKKPKRTINAQNKLLLNTTFDAGSCSSIATDYFHRANAIQKTKIVEKDRVNFTCTNIDTKHLKEVKDVEVQTNANLSLQSTANKKIQTSKLFHHQKKNVQESTTCKGYINIIYEDKETDESVSDIEQNSATSNYTSSLFEKKEKSRIEEIRNLERDKMVDILEIKNKKKKEKINNLTKQLEEMKSKLNVSLLEKEEFKNEIKKLKDELALKEIRNIELDKMLNISKIKNKKNKEKIIDLTKAKQNYDMKSNNESSLSYTEQRNLVKDNKELHEYVKILKQRVEELLKRNHKANDIKKKYSLNCSTTGTITDDSSMTFGSDNDSDNDVIEEARTKLNALEILTRLPEHSTQRKKM